MAGRALIIPFRLHLTGHVKFTEKLQELSSLFNAILAAFRTLRTVNENNAKTGKKKPPTFHLSLLNRFPSSWLFHIIETRTFALFDRCVKQMLLQ